LEYYTGLTFKVYVPGWGTEIGSGGRYDNLISNFGAAEPAVGFSFALDGLVGAWRNKQIQLAAEASQSIPLADNTTQAFREALASRANGKKVKLQ
jgi:ATP phosphoribosyltransferase regulatory subunit